MKMLEAYRDIEINGAMLEAHVKAFRLFPKQSLPFLVRQGIGVMGPRGEIAIDYDRWYPIAGWLQAFEAIANAIGPTKIFDIGEQVPRHAMLPPDVKDIHGSIRAVDIGYHMNHRKNGQLMFDGASGRMLEGIGHYGYASKASEPRRIVSVCENPYPCTFDRGILTAFARRFESKARVEHDDGLPCRANHGKSCTYHITW